MLLCCSYGEVRYEVRAHCERPGILTSDLRHAVPFGIMAHPSFVPPPKPISMQSNQEATVGKGGAQSMCFVRGGRREWDGRHPFTNPSDAESFDKFKLCMCNCAANAFVPA